MSRHRISALLVFAFALLMSSVVQGGATVVIQNGDAAGVGFNDPTPVSPVGGNSGTTLGQQRMIAVQAAANKWGATLDSVPAITALVTWDALSCDTNSAELGGGGPRVVWHDFPGVHVPATWFPGALANALSGSDLDPTTSAIRVHLNVNLGSSGCFTGVFFYLGLDNNHGGDVDLVGVATHELAHGLGFETFTDGTTGAELTSNDGTPLPSIFDDFLFDNTSSLLWKDMTDAQRVASAINTRRLVWSGFSVKTAVPQVLKPGTPLLKVTSPPAVAGVYSVGPADFGPALSSPGVTAQIVQAFDMSSSPSLVCSPLSGANATAVNGKIALIDRGTCNFTVKVENAQNAGAVGVLIADNVAGGPPDPLGGTDSTVFIPAVRISQADGVTLKSALSPGPVSATLGVNLSILQGADASNRVLMYTPNPYQGGSSVSHIDLIAFPDQLMSPVVAGDESHEVTPPNDLTAMFMQDMGWNLSLAASPPAPVLTSPADGSSVAGNPVLSWTASSGALSYDVYLGASPSPPLAVNTTLTSYTPQLLPGLYHWRVVATNANGSAGSATSSFTVTAVASCSYTLGASSAAFGGAGGNSSVTVTTTPSCTWTAASNANWIVISTGSSGTGNGTVFFSVSALPSAAPRSGTLTIAGLTFTVTQTAQTSSLLVPVAPCRIADTRNAIGPFGGPVLPAQSSRLFIIPNSNCNIPGNASAYSLNIAVVPRGPLGYLTAYPAGQPVPLVATLNSIDGRVKSNAAIVPAGTGGAVSIFVTDATDVIIDINGYFVSNGDPAALAFYPLTPCRVADTRNPNGPLGGPGFAGQDVRTFPVRGANCNIPAAARAYALNFAAVPNGPLGYMTAWPTGEAQPVVASLNATTGAVTANAVIVGAGTNGSVDVFAFSATDLVIDITGYFAPPGTGGLSLFNVTPCRVLDTRLPAGSPAFTGTLDVNVTASPCGVPASAQAYVFSATVVPPGPMGFLTMWPQGQPRPPTATLNAGDGAVTNNMAIIPTVNGSVSAFAFNPTHLVLDIFGYFGP